MYMWEKFEPREREKNIVIYFFSGYFPDLGMHVYICKRSQFVGFSYMKASTFLPSCAFFECKYIYIWIFIYKNICMCGL